MSNEKKQPTNHADQRFFRVVAVAEPKVRNDLIYVTVTLQNMTGEQKEERIICSDITQAYEFYTTQKNMLIKAKNTEFLNK